MRMLQLIKKYSWLVLLAGGLLSAWAFSPIGPTGNAGDSWQTATLGYPLGGDIGSPKNIGEEYRRNTPVMYYSYDANFSSYFGSNGIAAVDSGFGILNSLTNVSSYSSSLSEFPLYSQHANFTAESLFLTDLKSETFGLMVEEMGLVDPVQYTWTLRDRVHVNGEPPCPLGMEYLVIQRNLDTPATPLNVVQYSPYVNDTLYSYTIIEDCNPARAITAPFPVDPFALVNSPVASFAGTFIDDGFFYSGLTRDDVAGLRYLYSSNNILTESSAAGSVRLLTNSSPNVLLTTLLLGDLIAQSKTNPPATLQANFPGLEIASSTNFFVNEVTTNISLFFTNEPGPSITNFQPILFTNTLDLGLFAAQAATNNPAQLLALYPGLVIVSSNNYFTNIPIPTIVITTTPVFGKPAGTVKVVTTTNGFTPNVFEFWTYTFGNIFTNSFSPNSFVTIQTTSVKIPNGSTIGTPGVTNTVTTKILTHTPTGDFIIMPTNWCGFKITQILYTNVVMSTSNTITSSNTVSGTNLFTGTQTTFTSYTNHGLVIEPGICEPSLFAVTNFTTNIVVQFQTTFANVVTNTFFTNSSVIVITTNIGACSNGVAGTLCTNITSKVVILTNVPSGDFFIPPANWCGFTILSNLLTSFVGTTNTVVATIDPGINNIGQQFSVTTISGFTNHTFLIAPLTCTAAPDAAVLREGIENIKFVKVNFDSLLSQLFQPVTNLYTMVTVSNSQPAIRYYRRILTTAPDILFTAQDLAALAGGFAGNRSISYDQDNILPGLAGPGTINPPVTITLDKGAPLFFNNTVAFVPPIGETNQSTFFAWGSFDGSTNDPVVYPDGTSIQNIENQILIQITPQTLPDGTNNVAYPATTFTTTGGSFQAPFTWSLLPPSVLPQGLNLSSGGTISGTPANNPPGIYDFVIQMTDSLGRTVNWGYSINIPQ